jgi:hypothetical protein
MQSIDGGIFKTGMANFKITGKVAKFSSSRVR